MLNNDHTPLYSVQFVCTEEDLKSMINLLPNIFQMHVNPYDPLLAQTHGRAQKSSPRVLARDRLKQFILERIACGQTVFSRRELARMLQGHGFRSPNPAITVEMRGLSLMLSLSQAGPSVWLRNPAEINTSMVRSADADNAKADPT